MFYHKILLFKLPYHIISWSKAFRIIFILVKILFLHICNQFSPGKKMGKKEKETLPILMKITALLGIPTVKAGTKQTTLEASQHTSPLSHRSKKILQIRERERYCGYKKYAVDYKFTAHLIVSNLHFSAPWECVLIMIMFFYSSHASTAIKLDVASVFEQLTCKNIKAAQLFQMRNEKLSPIFAAKIRDMIIINRDLF